MHGDASSAQQSSLEDCQHVHCDEMSCESSSGSMGESAAHPPRAWG